MGLLCGRFATRGDYCGYHDPKRKRYIAQNKRRTRAGELGIKLAEKIVEVGSYRGQPTGLEAMDFYVLARAVLDALEGK